jgi:hypothetical protein
MRTPRTLGQFAWSWVVVAFFLAIIVGGGLTFMTSGHPYIADSFFLIGAFLFLLKFFTWELPRQYAKKNLIFTIITSIIILFTVVAICGNHYLNSKRSSILILSLKSFIIVDTKGQLSMELLFHNDGDKEFTIERVGIYFPPGNILSKLNENDTIDNNYNNKPIMSYVKGHLSYVGRGCKLPPDFPKVLKSGLHPLKLDIPFVVSEYYKEQQLVNIKRLVVGIMISISDYKGKSHELFIPPIIQIDIINDSEISGLAYRSPSTFYIDIENNHIMPAQVKGLRVKNTVLIPSPEGGVVVPAPPANTDRWDIKIK